MKAYYDARAPEYDEWYEGLGRFEGLDRPQWDEELNELQGVLAGLPVARTLDVACGTGFLTQHLPGEITGLDASEAMLEIARARVPEGTFVRGDGLALPFPDDSFERVFTGHFYGHLEEADRLRFLVEARRVARQIVIADAARRPDRNEIEWQERILNDGSRWHVFKRYFSPSVLKSELGGGKLLHSGRWFVVVAA